MEDWSLYDLEPEEPCWTTIRGSLNAIRRRAYGKRAGSLIVVSRAANQTAGRRSVFAWAYGSEDDNMAADRAIEQNERDRNIYAFHQRLAANGRLWYRHRLNKQDSRGLRIPVDWGELGNPPQAKDVDAWVSISLDIDPAPDLPKARWPEAQQHALDLVDMLKDSGVEIACVMDSGRGIQALWRPDEPAVRFTSIWKGMERLSRRLLAFVRGHADPALVSVDDTTNVNRFVRMPGSVNSKTGRRARILEGGL